MKKINKFRYQFSYFSGIMFQQIRNEHVLYGRNENHYPSSKVIIKMNSKIDY